CAVKQLVAPQARDDNHVGCADPLVEFAARADLEAVNGNPSVQETLSQLIGGVSEADCQALLGWKHSRALDHAPFDEQIAKQGEQNNDKRDYDPGDLGLA